MDQYYNNGNIHQPHQNNHIQNSNLNNGQQEKYYSDHKLRTNTTDVTETEDSKFSDFPLERELLKSIYNAGLSYPSPIQKKAIPVILSRQHILARAKNGTGKTAAFTIPAIAMIDKSLPRLQAVAVFPSRELAIQTHSFFKKLLSHSDEKIILAIGGTSVVENIKQIKEGRRIMIGTPGRLAHLFRDCPEGVKHCRMFIIDEADVLVSNMLLPVVEDLLSAISPMPQVLLFSATFPLTVKTFSDKWMPEAAQVNTMKQLTLRGVTPFYVYLEEEEKLKCLRYLMRKLSINQSIIFVNTVSRCELLHSHMEEMGFSVSFIHSKMDQNDRSRIYNSFRNSEFRHLVTTNLFTRGIDIRAVNVVVNFDFPSASETYLHRIGRSGRFGQVGLSVDLVTDKDTDSFYKIKKNLDLDIAPLPAEVDQALYT